MIFCEVPPATPFKPCPVSQFAKEVHHTAQTFLRKQGAVVGGVQNRGDRSKWVKNDGIYVTVFDLVYMEVGVVEAFNQNKPLTYGITITADFARHKNRMMSPCRSISVKIDYQENPRLRRSKFVLPEHANARPMMTELAKELSIEHSLNLCPDVPTPLQSHL